jgi:GT2 family glycosyltransferase
MMVSVVIPTYRRKEVLLDTLRALLALPVKAAEVLVVDQTEQHEETTERVLRDWEKQGRIRWIRLPEPSITHAMNRGLMEARGDLVLFLDDDVIPGPRLVEVHATSYDDPEVVGVVGQVLQPGQEAMEPEPRPRREGIWRDLGFAFNGTRPVEIANVMAGNLSVRREAAIRAGGFDEQFKGVAYRFETEFARRLLRETGGRLRFEPEASLRHLQAASGGTRAYGNPLCSASPAHSVGEYYFGLREARGRERIGFLLWRMFRAVRTRYHAARPWCIAVKLVGEIRGMLWAFRLYRSGPVLLSSGHSEPEAEGGR